MRDIKLLITSVGRRVELVQALKSAALRLDINLTIYGADITNTSSALYFCDKQIMVPRIVDPCYIPELLSLCSSERIDAVLPTIDTDLLILSQNKKLFDKINTKVFISAEDKIKICRDKRLTSKFFEKCGLHTPKSIDNVNSYNAIFPCFIKPFNGSSSVNALRIETEQELYIQAKKITEYIIQPFIEGKEYTVDIFCDFNGKPLLITPRERIAVRTGEVIKTRICQDQKIIDECQELIKYFHPCGALTVQLIRQASTGIDYFIEINPRVGGGMPLSIKAGADSAECILRLLSGEELSYQAYAAADGNFFSRFDQSICTNIKTCKKIEAVIFDLDDTLYSEKDYVRSGFKAVAKLIPEVENAELKLWHAFEKKLLAIDTVLAESRLCDKKKECLNAYRTHFPQLHLYDGVDKSLQLLRDKKIKIGIITDGRPDGQKKKMQSLGLYEFVDEVIITDELGGSQFRKPNDIAFRVMQCRMKIPFGKMVYIGDNIHKDFIAPRQLGMGCVLFDNEDGLYRASPPLNIKKVSSFPELIRFIGV